MSPKQFFAVLFGRAAATVRAKYGPTTYIDASGPMIRIANTRGVLGAGHTLKDAMREADGKLTQVRVPEELAGTSFPVYVDTDVVLDTDIVRT